MSLPPYSPSPQAPTSQGYFSDAGPFGSGASPFQTGAPRRGMVNQVRVVAILNMIQGVMELLMCLMVGLVGGMFVVMRDQMIADMARNGEGEAESMVTVISIGALLIAAITLVTGLMRLISGARNIVFRSRVLTIVSLFAGLTTCCTVYCAPTSLAIAVYGLIVFFNREVSEAFEMRAQGASTDDVLRTFNARPY